MQVRVTKGRMILSRNEQVSEQRMRDGAKRGFVSDRPGALWRQINVVEESQHYNTGEKQVRGH